MSSLAATQADGYYIPPAYLESGAYKKKSLNQYNNSKGHNQYLTRSVCRFELPTRPRGVSVWGQAVAKERER
jgi:coiled-coil domain-containing protein 130